MILVICQRVRLSSASLLQAPWLSQSSLIGHPAEQAERYEDVLALSTRIIELAPENIPAHLLQGRMLSILEREEEAKTTYTRALELAKQAFQKRPDDVQPLVYQADALWMLGYEDKALQTYDKVIRQAPDTNLRSNIQFRTGGEASWPLRQGVVSNWYDANATWYDYAQAYINKGWRLFALARYKEALQNYEQALRLQPDNTDTHYRKGCVLWDLWKYEDALRAANEAIAIDPTYVRAHSLKATALFYLGREEEAEKAQEQYAQLIQKLEKQVLL